MPRPAASQNSSSSRAVHLDSLRGLAAMAVVTAHFLAAFYPWSVFANPSMTAHFAWESAFHWPPLSLFTAGHFAVCLFFVLSGYVLSVSFIGEPNRTRRILGAIVKRPFRLLGLAIASLIVGALLWAAGWLFHREIGELAGSGEWLGLFWVGDFDWSVFWRTLLMGKAGSEYNPPLWTIKIEVIGSFLVFFTLLATNWLPRIGQFLALGALLFATLGTYYDGFAIGMLFALLFKPAPNSSAKPEHRPGPLALGMLSAVAILLAAYPYYAAEMLIPDWSGITRSISMAGAAIVFLIVHQTAQWRDWLSHPWLIRLGELSYAVYVIHFLLMGSLTAWLVLHLTPVLGYGPATLLAALVSLPCLLVLSALAIRWVDQPCIAIGRKVEQYFYRLLPQKAAQ